MTNDYAQFLANSIFLIEKELLFNWNNITKRELSYPFYLGFNNPHRVKEENNIKRIIEHYYGPKVKVIIERGKYRTLFIFRILEEEKK